MVYGINDSEILNVGLFDVKIMFFVINFGFVKLGFIFRFLWVV